MNFNLEEVTILFNTAEGYVSELSDEKMMELFEDYYINQLRNSEIIEKYFGGESGRVNFRKFFPFVQSDEVCPNCGEKLVFEMPGKSVRLRNYHPEKMFCLNCGHEEGFCVCCHCDYCEKIREVAEREEHERQLKLMAERAELKRKREEAVQLHIAETRELNPPVLLSELTVSQRLMLVAFLTVGTEHTTENIWLGEQVGYCLGPIEKMTDYIYNQLKEQGLIVYSFNTPEEAFDENFYCYPYAAVFDLNVVLDGESDKTLYQELMGVNEIPVSNSEDVYEELYKWWIDIAAAECLECLEYRVNLMDWRLRCGEKTYKTIYTLLEKYSVSQVYYFIYRAITNASKYVLEKGLSPTQAANMVIYHLASDHEYYESQGWVPSKYRKIKELPQSAISYAFSNIFTNLNIDEFDECPSIELLKKKTKVKIFEDNKK